MIMCKMKTLYVSYFENLALFYIRLRIWIRFTKIIIKLKKEKKRKKNNEKENLINKHDI